MATFFLSAFLVIVGAAAFALIVRSLWRSALAACADAPDGRARKRRALSLSGGLCALILLLTRAQDKGDWAPDPPSGGESAVRDEVPDTGGADGPVDSEGAGGAAAEAQEMPEAGAGESLLSGAARALSPGPAVAALPQAALDAGFVFVGAVTNIGTAWAADPPGAPAFPGRPFGFSELGAWLPGPSAFAFLFGTNAVTEIYASSSGTLAFNFRKTSPRPPPGGIPDGTGVNWLAPFQTLVGVTPPGGAVLYEAGTNSALFTWRGVTPGRAPPGATNPCSATVQAELYPNGDFAFRYRFPNPEAFPEGLPFLIGAQNGGGGQTVLLTNTLAALDPAILPAFELRWRSLDGIDPADPDQDGDGLTTLDELFAHGTDFRRADTDGDGLSDAEEIALGSDPFDPDENSDGVPDGFDLAGYSLSDPDLAFRLANGIGPGVDLALDTDADGWPDWLEARFGTDPASAQATPEGLDTLFRLTVSLASPPPEPGVLSVGGRRALVAGPGSWVFWLPAGEAHAASFASPRGAPPPFGFAFNRPAAARYGVPAPEGRAGGFGIVALPLLAVSPDTGWCCHYGFDPCAVFTAHAMPPMPGTFAWTVGGVPAVYGTNRIEVGHDASEVRARFTPAGAAAYVEACAPSVAHCSGFHEAVCGGVIATNLVFANTDDDDGDTLKDNADNYVSNEDDLKPVIPFTVPSCCACPSHSATNWTCSLTGLSGNLRVYASSNKTVRLDSWSIIASSQTVHVEGLESSTNRHADWIEWKYEGVVEAPGGGLAATNFTVSTVWTVVDLLAAPVRLEPVTAATNAVGTVVNPAGIASNAVAVYRVEVVPEGIVPDEDIGWSVASGDVTFYSSRDTGREAHVRGLAPGDFTLEVSVQGLPETYRPHIHGRVLTPTVTPIRVYIICDASGTPAVSTNTVNAWVAEANRIYRQVAMSFYVAGVEHITNRADWFTITTNFSQMCSYASDTGGLELYCVGSIVGASGLHSDRTLGYDDPRRGMAVGSSAPVTTLAHELGHACGLADLYEYDPGDGLVSEDKTLPLNWSGGPGTGYHAPSLAYRDLTYRAIMNAPQPSFPRADIPLDYLTVVSSGTNRNPISVGLDQMSTRVPTH